MLTKTSKVSVLARIALMILIVCTLMVVFSFTVSAAPFDVEILHVDYPVGGYAPDFNFDIWIGKGLEPIQKSLVRPDR